MYIKGTENEKANNSIGKSTSEVQCYGQWICPLQTCHIDLLDKYESHLIAIKPSLSLNLRIRDILKTDALQKSTTYCEW